MIFDLFAKSLHLILLYLGWRKLSHYLDNYWFIYPNWLAVTAHSSKFDLIYSDFSFSMQVKKDKIDTIINFLQIELDIKAIKTRLFLKKLQCVISFGWLNNMQNAFYFRRFIVLVKIFIIWMQSYTFEKNIYKKAIEFAKQY